MKKFKSLTFALAFCSVCSSAQESNFIYDTVLPFHEGYAMVMKDGKCGYIDKSGTVRIPLQYEFAGDFYHGMAPVLKSKDGLTIHEPNFREKSVYYDDIFYAYYRNIAADMSFGLIDRNGKLILPYEYEYAFKEQNGFTVNDKDGKKCYVDSYGNFSDYTNEKILSIIFTTIYKGDSTSLIDGYGKTVFSTTGHIDITTSWKINDSIYIIRLDRDDDHALMIDQTGSVIATLSCWDVLDKYEDTYVVIVLTGQKKYYLKNKNRYGSMLKPIDDAKYLLKDHNDRNLTSRGYEYISGFQEGLAFAARRNCSGYLDSKGSVAIPFKYRMADNFHEGLARVVKGKHFGFIDHKGKTIIPFIYDDACSYREGYAAVKKDGKWGFIDKSGNPLNPIQ